MTQSDTDDNQGSARSGGSRLAKIIAHSGLCSRRDAERMIEAGRVKVNGVVVSDPAVNLDDWQGVSVDDRPLSAPPDVKLYRFYKPLGALVTDRDPEGRTTVYDLLPDMGPGAPRLLAVGRLDINSEGLLLFTNSPVLKRKLELPDTGLSRIYRVRAHGMVTDRKLADKKRAAKDGRRMGVGRSPSSTRNSRTPRRGG